MPQQLNHNKIQEIKGHLDSWTNSEFKKLVQNVAHSLECSSWVQKIVLIQAQKLKNIIKNIQGTCDMIKYSVKYIGMDQSSNKDIYKINVKKDLQCSFKTKNIEVLGIFQRGYPPSCYNHCSSLFFHY